MTMEEALLRCPHRAAPLCKEVMQHWRHATGEQLDPTSERTVLLGDRQPHPQAHDPQPVLDELPFQVMRLCMLSVLIDCQRQDDLKFHKKKSPPRIPTTHELLRRVHRAMAVEVKQQWHNVRNGSTHRKEDFQDAWIRRGHASITRKGELQLHLLAPHTAAAKPEPNPGAVTTYHTDGAGPEKGKAKAAGWGYVAAETPRGGTLKDTTYSYNYGHVEVNEEERLYVGATGKTNNAGELTAVLYAIRKGLTEPDDVGFTLYTDSMLALKAATFAGARRKAGHKRPSAQLTKRVQAAAHELVRRKGLTRVRFYKVKGHSDDPWNDLADELAAIGREHGHNQGKAAVERRIAEQLTKTLERVSARTGGQPTSQTQARQGEGVT